MCSIFCGRQILSRTEIVPEGKKKLTYKLFFHLTCLWLCLGFLYKVGRFSVKKNHRNRSKITQISHNSQQVDFFSSDKRRKPLSGSVDHGLNVKLKVDQNKAIHRSLNQVGLKSMSNPHYSRTKIQVCTPAMHHTTMYHSMKKGRPRVERSVNFTTWSRWTNSKGKVNHHT